MNFFEKAKSLTKALLYVLIVLACMDLILLVSGGSIPMIIVLIVTIFSGFIVFEQTVRFASIAEKITEDKKKGISYLNKVKDLKDLRSRFIFPAILIAFSLLIRAIMLLSWILNKDGNVALDCMAIIVGAIAYYCFYRVCEQLNKATARFSE